MRATPSITWLLLLPSLGMCSTSSSYTPPMPSSAIILSTNDGTTVNPMTIEPTVKGITTPTNEPQVTNAPEITTSASPSSDLSKTSTQTMTNAAATIPPVTSLPSNEPEQTPPPKTTKSSSPPSSTSDGHHLTTAGALPLGPATISKSRTTAQTTPHGIDRSLIQTTTPSQPSNPPDQPSELPTSLPDIQGNKGTTLNTEAPTFAPPPEKTSTKSWSGTEAGSTPGLSSTGPRSTVKPNFSIYTPSQTTITPRNTEASRPPDGTTTQIIFNPKALPNKFTYSLLDVLETVKEKGFAELCKKLMPNWQNGTCILMWRQFSDKVHFDSVEINGQVKTSLAEQYYEEMTQEDISTKKPTDYKTLIAILASCGALLIMIIILTVCASHHRKPCNENQQYLTEELHTVENCYHDNPTLEVMESQPEMQEKKVVLNGEFNDSWIVPIDNMIKEDIPDEEDTHL
ncbi:podocalyxin [Nematolebias whitei]|uniref:podocalyxin n=1 Tax=Nematolebias whitei TaxID=451745 RepID=UPI00189ADAD5|nr:podocalyxin [Nematolebias whitei]